MATIIRRDDITEARSGRTVRAVAFDFTDMRGQADGYLTTVRHEAAKIVQQAHQQAEQIRRQAEAAGRHAAEKAIERILDEKVAKQMETLLPALRKLVTEIKDAKGQWLDEWEHSAVHVAAAMAERIIRRQLDRQPEIQLELVREALELAAGSAEVTLHLNPADHEHLGPQATRLAEALSPLAPATVVADPSISPGGCRVETKHGQIDQQIESQLRRIEQELA
jgi:flagellar biosynthesis/type III secretory pathway protein FliH